MIGEAPPRAPGGTGGGRTGRCRPRRSNAHDWVAVLSIAVACAGTARAVCPAEPRGADARQRRRSIAAIMPPCHRGHCVDLPLHVRAVGCQATLAEATAVATHVGHLRPLRRQRAKGSTQRERKEAHTERREGSTDSERERENETKQPRQRKLTLGRPRKRRSTERETTAHEAHEAHCVPKRAPHFFFPYRSLSSAHSAHTASLTTLTPTTRSFTTWCVAQRV